jgi:hypothetical protein
VNPTYGLSYFVMLRSEFNVTLLCRPFMYCKCITIMSSIGRSVVRSFDSLVDK